ncbi:MAG: ABC transporter substrate-binding protein [Pseudomonadota bacterium]
MGDFGLTCGDPDKSPDDLGPCKGADAAPLRRPQRWLTTSLLGALAAVALLLAGSFTADGQTPDEPDATDGTSTATAPYRIAIFTSSDADACYTPGLVKAIRQFTSDYAADVNANGGIRGRPLALSLRDDLDTAANTVKNVEAALREPNLIGMIGVPSSTRGKAVFDALGLPIRESRLPFITEISLNGMFADQPHVFTLASAVSNEVDLLRAFIADKGYTRPAFVGLRDNLYARALGDGLAATPTDGLSAPVAKASALAVDHRLNIRGFSVPKAQAAPVIADLKAKRADVLFLGIQSSAGEQFLRHMLAADLQIPVFVVLGRISRMMRNANTRAYAAPLFQFAWDGVPNAFNERLRRRIWRSGDPQRWIFEDLPAALPADEWRLRGCKTKPPRTLRVLDDRNRRAIGRGAQYRDMLALMVQAAREAPPGLDVLGLRAHIAKTIAAHRKGERVLHGWWQDWSFTRARASAADTLIITRPGPGGGIRLAPRQYVRTGQRLEARSVVYLSLDLEEISRIDTNDRSFDASFYLSLRSEDEQINIRSIEFTNAYRSQTGGGTLISVREIHDGARVSNFPAGVKLYRVAGKFVFEPELGQYPFDTQRLSISFQPATTSKPFLIQPPAKGALVTQPRLDGWRARDAYVGSDQDIIPTLDRSIVKKRIVPFYKFNSTWVVQRIAVDYYLRVVIPLGFILLITYFSVFLRASRFESTMGIQVTALLSAIALYLALPKVDTDQATLSDKIFMATYAAVALMIGLSILKDHRAVARWRSARWLVSLVQIVVFPVAVVTMLGALLLGARGPEVSLMGELAEVWRSLQGG